MKTIITRIMGVNYIYQITIIIEPDGDGYYAQCPGLPGVFAYGDTEEEAMLNAKNGAIGILYSKMKYGDETLENDNLKKLY